MAQRINMDRNGSVCHKTRFGTQGTLVLSKPPETG